MKTALLVAGMHRSGTSALTRLLSLAGAALPRDLLGAGPGNEEGHWEPAPVMALDDAILRERGAEWHTPFPVGGATAHHLPAARALVREQWGGAPLIVFKEPRATLLLALWIAALEAEGYRCRCVLTVRHPREVAASLEAAHGLVPMHGLMCWATYMAAADLATRRRPRMVVRFDRLLAEPAAVLAELATFAPELRAVAPDAAASVRSVLRHQHAAPEPWPEALAPLAALFAHCEALADGGAGDPEAAAAATEWLGRLRVIVEPLLAERQRDCFAATRTGAG